MKVICGICGKSFNVKPYRLKKGEGKYCSLNCSRNEKAKKIAAIKKSIALKGHFVSEETRMKISLANKGKKHTEEWKRIRSELWKKKGIMKGDRNVTKRPEVRKKISEALKKRIGDKNACWRGGKTSLWQLIRGLENSGKWRLEVFKRDRYACQICKDDRGHNLNAHHIKPFKQILNDFIQKYNQFSLLEEKHILARLAITYKPFWDIDNGITLCEECHKKNLYDSRKFISFTL